MGTISVSLPSDGETIDAADYNTPVSTIVNEINGNLDNSNLASDAAISGSKLADNSIDLGSKVSTWDGWIEVADSWSYASATTVTVPTDATAKYAVGDKIRFDQSGVKYFQVTAVASTTLTLFGIGGATVANAAISDIKYSKSNPVGYSQAWQDWTPTWTNVSGGTLNYAKYTQIGKTVNFRIKYTLGGAGVSGNIIFSTPVAINADVDATNQILNVSALLFDTGTAGYPGVVRWDSSTTMNIFVQNAAGTFVATAGANATTPFTWASGDVISVAGTYEAA